MATLDNRSSGQSDTNATQYVVADVPVGTAAANRRVKVGIYSRTINGPTIVVTDFTIGGVEATEIASIVAQEFSSGTVSDYVGIYTALVPDGETATLDVTFAAEQLRFGYVIGTAAVEASATDTLVNENEAAGGGEIAIGGEIDVEEDGIIFAIAGAGIATSATWSGLTEFADSSVEASTFSGAYLDSATAETGRAVSATWADGFNLTLVAASFAPAATAIIIEAEMSAAGTSTAGAISPDVEEPETTPASELGGGGAFGHPDLLRSRRKKKPAKEAPAADADSGADAEADFLILWEAVKIRSDPARRKAIEDKRKAMLRDLEKAAEIRNPGKR